MTLREEAEHLLDQLVHAFPLGYRPTIRWRKMSVSAGKAYFLDQSIGLSTSIITDRLRLQDTLVHEYAHLLAYAREGRRGVGHGEAWRQAMRDLGARPEVYHNYPVERRRHARNLKYRCEQCGYELSRVRPLMRGRVYRHVDCGGRIRPAS